MFLFFIHFSFDFKLLLYINKYFLEKGFTLIQMTQQPKEWVSDIYWNSIIKNILSEHKQFIFTIELWEQMKDKFGYPFTKDHMERELKNLQRVGYAIPVIKRGKQAWMYPTGEKLKMVETNINIDTTIADFIISHKRVPTEEEVTEKLNEFIDHQIISERKTLITKLMHAIDEIIRKSCGENLIRYDAEKNLSQQLNPSCDADRQEMSFYESIIDTLNGEVKDIDFLILTRIIDARKKFINTKE